MVYQLHPGRDSGNACSLKSQLQLCALVLDQDGCSTCKPLSVSMVRSKIDVLKYAFLNQVLVSEVIMKVKLC